MSWRELCARDVPRAAIDRVSDALFAAGAAGIQEDHAPGEAPAPRQPWDTGPPLPPPATAWLRAWYEDADEDAVTARVRAALPDADLHWADVEEQDWETSWQAGFPRLVVSARLAVAPPWEAEDGDVVVEPGEGFGTGAHETTRGALHRLDALADAPEVRTVWDVGCGSGILALAAARLGLQAAGVDIDEAALANARHNAALSGLDVPFSATPVHALGPPADLVLANLYAEVLVELAPELLRLTGRHLVLAGVLAHKEHLVRDAFATLRLSHRDVDGEWVCLHYRREAP